MDKPKRRGRRIIAMWQLFACILLASCSSALALDPSIDINQYAHTAWRVRDGFGKGFFYSIAQTPDGYLWLGTEFGLLRFDGVRAVPWQPPPGQQLPSNEIPKLLVTRDGALWIGTTKGLASWKDQKLTTYDEVKQERIASLFQDRDGTVWIGTSKSQLGGKLCAFQNHTLRCENGNSSFNDGVYPLFEDTKGNFWVGVAQGFWKWKPDEPQFFPVLEVLDDHPNFGQDEQGALLIGTNKGIQRLVSSHLEPYSLPGLSPLFNASRQQNGGPGILRDRDGGLWIGTRDRGLVHFHQGKTDTFSEADGLSANTAVSLLEDKEGNIWVVTPNGLDRFRDYAVPSFANKQGLSSTGTLSVLASKDGSVWIATYDGLNRWKAGYMSVLGGPLFMAHSLFEDSSGRIWVATNRQFGYLADGRFVPVRNLPDGWVDSIAEVPRGHLWVAIREHGLFQLAQGNVIQKIPWADLGHKDPVRVLVTDPSQRGLWLGFAQGGVAYFADGRIQNPYSVDEGVGAGKVNGLGFGMRGALWVATESGLTRIKDGRVTTFSSNNGLPCNTVHWSIDDDEHTVWIQTACGLVRIGRSEWDAWIGDPTRSVKTTVFDVSDGVGSHSYSPEVHGVTKSADGKIWFVAFHGLSVIDPRRLHFNQIKPPVHIEQVIADRETYEAAQGLRLPPRVRDLKIDFTALSFVAPEKVKFRYKLEGYDEDWQEAGARREAFYTNLPPRNYRFRVMACNNSGVWNQEGALLDFSIDPAYYQTTWFRVLVGVAFLASLWAAYQLRARHLAMQFNTALEARVSERTRIARELHDTLLQSFQGLLLRFHSASKLLPAHPNEAKQRLDSAIAQGAEAITEGRDAVQGLRSSAFETNDLANSITAIAEELTSDTSAIGSPAIDLEVEGTPRNLNPVVRDEACRIAGEALRNAFRHSHARRISVELRYEKRNFSLQVRDDGKGIAEDTIKQPAGRFGLLGMRERADIVGGRLEIWSRLDSGTEVELSIPAAIAYDVSTRESAAIVSANGRRTRRKQL